MMIITTNGGMPPGGIIYTDPRTPAAKWDDNHTWLAERATQVIRFRNANPGIYPEPEWTNFDFVRQQIVEFNCPRYPAGYCVDSTPPPPPPPEPDHLCPACNAAMSPVYCRTCGGNKINSYHCAACNKEYPK